MARCQWVPPSNCSRLSWPSWFDIYMWQMHSVEKWWRYDSGAVGGHVGGVPVKWHLALPLWYRWFAELPPELLGQWPRLEYRVKRWDKQRVLTPGHQGWNDLHSLCRIGMEYYLLNNDDNNIIYWIMMIMIIMMMMMMIIIIIRMTMMIMGTTTIMIMIIIITTTLTMTIMKMIMIKTAQTPCQSLYKDRRI